MKTGWSYGCGTGSSTGASTRVNTSTGRAWIDAIRSGRADKVVLARDVVATAPEPLDVRWLLHRLVGAYPDTWTFAVDGLVGATPEMLVRLDDGHVFSRVLAGTASRAADVEDDQHAADDLLAPVLCLALGRAVEADGEVADLDPLGPAAGADLDHRLS